MIEYSDSTYFKNYHMSERNAICGNCGTRIGKQRCTNTKDVFYFEIRVMDRYKYCPYCGEPLFREEK